MIHPTISVILSTFNKEHYLSGAIESILDQTFKDFEFIIIDDGSDDGSGDIIERYAARDDRIIVHHQKNMGLTKSLNVALGISRGRFIARQDADDISLKQRLELQLQFLVEKEAFGIVGCDFEVIDDDDHHIAVIRQSEHNHSLKRKLERKNPFVHGSLLMRRAVIEELAGYDEYYTYSQDYDLLLRASRITELHILPNVLYKWRFSRKGISRNCKTAYGQRALENHARRKQGLEENFSPLPAAQDRIYPYSYEIGIRYLAGHRMWQARKNFLLSLLQEPFVLGHWFAFLVSLCPAILYKWLGKVRSDLAT